MKSHHPNPLEGLGRAWDELQATRSYTTQFPPREVLMTVAQTAEFFDVHPSTVRRWISQGILEAIRPTPRTVRLRVNDVKRLAEPPAPAPGDRPQPPAAPYPQEAVDWTTVI